MNKLGQFITTVVIGGFAVFLAALIALSMTRTEEDSSSTLAETLEKYPKNLDFAALVVPDVYGPEEVAGLIVCPGTTEEQLSDIPAAEAGIDFEDGKVADDVNYFITMSSEQEYSAEKLQRSNVDLCRDVLTQVEAAKAQGQDVAAVYPVQPQQPMQFLRAEKDDDSTRWHFAG